MDVAVPLGIIVNELVSNSLKHAFPGRDRGKIQIELHTERLQSLGLTAADVSQQLRALLECLQALAVQQTETSSLRSGPDVASALQHGHAPNLRCRECVDPASEQRLFSRLLGVRKIPGNDAGQP